MTDQDPGAARRPQPDRGDAGRGIRGAGPGPGRPAGSRRRRTSSSKAATSATRTSSWTAGRRWHGGARSAGAVSTDRPRPGWPVPCRRPSTRPSRGRPPSSACSPRCRASPTSARSRSSPSSTCRCGASCRSDPRTGCCPAPATSTSTTSSALSTNPPFVQALLAGANQQTTGELRWRNIPMVTRWSPLRKFWQRAGGELGHQPDQAVADAENRWAARPWPRRARRGGGRRLPDDAVPPLPGHRRLSVPGRRRLHPAPGERQLLGPAHGRKDPTFIGTIGPDITFFGFPVPPEALAHHWVVLEEPPAGYRFYHEDHAARREPGSPRRHLGRTIALQPLRRTRARA